MQSSTSDSAISKDSLESQQPSQEVNLTMLGGCLSSSDTVETETT